jgi:DNA-binding PadR family transcriptional regulator
MAAVHRGSNSPELVTLRPVLSSLSYAILALLAKKPQSGYDLARQMKPPLGFLWQARHGQIYPELARLVKSGLATFEKIDQGGGPPRRVHSITARGRAELARWVLEAPQVKPPNDEFVVKAYALQRVPATKAAALLQNQLNSHGQRLAVLEQLAEALRSTNTHSLDIGSARFGEYAALRRAIGSEREYIAWCRWLAGELTSVGSIKRARGERRNGPSRSSLAVRRR